VADDWPFDEADQHDPLAKLRIPVLQNPYPMWKYEVCVVIIDPADDSLDARTFGPALRPTDLEVKQILAELDYRMDWYRESWKAKMRERPLDVDSGTNTLILQKRAEGDWRYRRMSFEHGLWPFYNMTQRFTLEALLDHINDLVPEKWAAWKARYPEAFGELANRAHEKLTLTEEIDHG
jgi:hypothetical protein